MRRTPMEDYTGLTVEKTISGKHFEVVGDDGFEVTLSRTDGEGVQTVDRRRFSPFTSGGFQAE